jgi:oxygen-independent coproporphyrinogen-3 oxidase
VFNYAHLPERFKPQRRISDNDLPSPEEKLEILKMTFEHLEKAGYVYIGMDHFAKPDDELAQAQRDGTLYRNFQGYSTHADCDLIGLGVTSIGMVGPTYSQNQRTLAEYNDAIDADKLPLFRGLELTRDDLIRRDVITRIICHFTLDFNDVASKWGIDFREYFGEELASLHDMEQDGLLAIGESRLDVMPRGRLLIRNVCMAFDIYLKNREQQVKFSRVI